MGLFDPPTKSIAKKVPVSIQPTLATVQVFAEQQFPESVFGRTKAALLVAMVMGSWVNAHARVGTFQMSPRDFSYVQNMYNNCARMAGYDAQLALPVILELAEKGMFPEGFKEVLGGL